VFCAHDHCNIKETTMGASPLLERKQYTSLVRGNRYAITNRQPIPDAKEFIFATLGSNAPAILTLTLNMPSLSSWEEIRQVYVGRIISTNHEDDRLEFEGLVPNGPMLLPVTVAFFGVTDGYVEVSL
jgi:hypothetical protein